MKNSIFRKHFLNTRNDYLILFFKNEEMRGWLEQGLLAIMSLDNTSGKALLGRNLLMWLSTYHTRFKLCELFKPLIYSVTKPNFCPLTQCLIKPIYWHQVAVKESTVFILRQQARRKCSWHSKDPNFPKAFRSIFKDSVRDSVSGWVISSCTILLIGWWGGNKVMFWESLSSAFWFQSIWFYLLVVSTWLTFSTLLFCVTRNQQMDAIQRTSKKRLNESVSSAHNDSQESVSLCSQNKHQWWQKKKEKQNPRSLPKTP